MGARIRDADGDIWTRDSDSGWSQHDTGCWVPHRWLIDELFGPTSEVEE